MKKMLIAVCFLFCAPTLFAEHCPQPNDIYTYENGVIKPVAPFGWMFGSVHYLDSSHVRFIWAAWAEKRIDSRDERRVLCIYGNPDWGAHGVILETVNIVDKSRVTSHPEWKAYGDEYYRCERNNPAECPFG